MAVTLDAQEFLSLVERAGAICFWDTEATGLSGDYNSMLVSSIKPFNRSPVSFVVTRPGDDRRVALATKEELEKYSCWVTYYGKGYDRKLLRTRLLRWGLEDVEDRPHLDLYWTLKNSLNTSRRSQAHLLQWLGLSPEVADQLEQKMAVSAEVWNAVLAHPRQYLPTLRERCESDCTSLEGLYKKVRHIPKEIKR